MGKTLLSLWGLKPPDIPPPSPQNGLGDEMEAVEQTEQTEPPVFICTLRAPPDRLRDATPRAHSFFAPKQAPEVKSEPPPVAVAEKTPAPQIMCTLRADPAKLRAIKPRVHGFFVKKTAPPPSQLAKELQSIAMPSQPACWPRYHVRPPRQEPLPALPRRDRLPVREFRARRGPSGPAVLYGPPLPSLVPELRTEKPERRVLTAESARELAGTPRDPLLADLAERAGLPQPFDLGDSETQLWTQKYAPKSPDHCINAQAARLAYRWLKRRMHQLKSGPVAPRRRENDFIDDGGDYSYLLLHGPSGMGKTATVYAAAEALGAFVFEINSSQRRSGKEVISLLEGIGHSRAVHSGGAEKCVILIDDADVLFESEATFFSTLDRIAQTTRRPIVLTCQDLDRLPYSVLDAAEQLYIGPGDLVRAVDYAWLVALCEGHLLSKEVVAHTVVRHNGDLCKSLAHLQFWCQMGVGGRPSASDWVLTEPGFDRVISVNTPVELPPTHYETPVAPGCLSAEDIAETLSALDAHRRPGELREPFDDALQEVPAPEWVESTELPVERYAVDVFPPVARRPLQRLRDAVYSGGRDGLLVTDYAPYARAMALADRERDEALATADGGRRSRRSWAARGLDGRKHLANGEAVLRCGAPGSGTIN